MEALEGASTVERVLMQRASENRIPVNGSLELLPLCNMNCDMCYVRLSREEMEHQGRLRTVDEWILIAGQMQKAGVLFLLLTGGEPLLYPGFKRLYMELRQMGMILTINTNGTLIDEEWAEFFGKYKPRRINVTLYGSDEAAYRELCHYPGGFDKVIKGIRLLKKYEVDVKLGGSLTKVNRDDVDKIIEIGEDLGVPVRIDTYMLPAVRERRKPYNEQARLEPLEAARGRIQVLKKEMGRELFDQYVHETLLQIAHMEPAEKEEPGHMSCMAGKCSFTINWQGEMRPCVMFTEPAASVFELGFKAAWECITGETDKILLSSRCRICRMRFLCRTCAASAFLETGSYDGTPEYMCEYTKESLRLLQEHQEKMEYE